MYCKEILARFSNPTNAGLIKGADGTGEAIETKLGEIMRFYLKIENEIIVDAKFKTFGGVAAIAVSDITCEVCKGKSVLEANKITGEEILEKISEIREDKLVYINLAIEGIHNAILDYNKKQEKIKKQQEKNEENESKNSLLTMGDALFDDDDEISENKNENEIEEINSSEDERLRLESARIFSKFLHPNTNNWN